MAERESSSKVEEENEYPEVTVDERRAVFVDTNLDTHLAIPISPLYSVSSLKRQISVEHFNCFPTYGRIIAEALLVKVNENFYHLPDTMLLKTAFHGATTTWFLFADVRKPINSLEAQNCFESEHIKPSTQHLIEFQRVEPSLAHLVELKKAEVDPCMEHRDESKQVEPPQPCASSDMDHKTRRGTRREDLNKICIDGSLMQPTEMSKPKENVETRSDNLEAVMIKQMDEQTIELGQWPVPRAGKVSDTTHLDEPCEGHRDTSVVQPSEMLLEDDSDNIVKDLKEGSELVHQLEGTIALLTETFNKESGSANVGTPPGSRAKKTNKTKKSNIDVANQSHTAPCVQGPDFLEKDALYSDCKNYICDNEEKGDGTAEEVSPSELNSVPEPLQPDPLNLVKEIKEDNTLLKSVNTARKRKAIENGQESRGTTENVSSLSLNNVPELLVSESESLNLVEREKELVENVTSLKSENTAKKRKINKAKSSGTENQALSSKGPSDDKKEDDGRHICGKLALGDAFGSPEHSVETVSRKLKKRSQNKKASPGKDPITAIQSEKHKKIHKKKPDPAQDLSSLPGNQRIEDAAMEVDAPKSVEQADDILTHCDAPLKSENTAKRKKTKANKRDGRKTTEDLSPLLRNNVPKVLSPQEESLNLVEREKEIEEDVCLKSENTAKKLKSNTANSSGEESKDLSSKKKNDGKNLGDTRHIHGDLSLEEDISRPEDSVETPSGKLKKRSENRRAVSGMDPPGFVVNKHPDEEAREISVKKLKSNTAKSSGEEKEDLSGKRKNDGNRSGDTRHSHGELLLADDVCRPEDGVETLNAKLKKRSQIGRAVPGMDPPGSPANEHPGEEMREITSPVTVIQSDKAQKKHKKKQPAPAQDLSSLSVNQHFEEPVIKMDTPIPVEEADGRLPNYNIDDSKNREVIQGEGDQDELREIRPLEVPSGLEDLRYLEKPRVRKQEAKKRDQPSSVDTSSNGHKLVGSKKNTGSAKFPKLQKCNYYVKDGTSMPPLSAKHSKTSEVMDTVIPLADPTKTSRKAGVSRAIAGDGSNTFEASSLSSRHAVKKIRPLEQAKEPLKKLKKNSVDLKRSSRVSGREALNASGKKKGLFSSSGAIFGEGFSSSSDDDDKTDALSSSSTLPPENLSSSDYSEGESQGVVISQQDTSNGKGRSNANASGLKLESILRSSSRYKKAKLVASQSQDESQPLEFVPDSQA